MRRLTVWEHERIAVVDHASATERALTRAEADALAAITEGLDGPPITLGHRSVKFGSHCGVVQAGGVSVEVLPKVADDAAFDRGVLLRMLAVASDFPLARVDGQKVALQSHTLLLALIRWFCDELFGQFHQGLLREYVTQHEALGAIRGRWRPDIDATRHPGRRDKLHCEFDELTADNRYNQALKAALRVVRPLTLGSERLQTDVGLLIAWLADVADVRVTAERVRRLPGNRLVARYARALRLAEWFLASTAPDVRTGHSDGLALLFDMNALFQAFLAAALRRALPEGLHLREEGPRHHLTRDLEGQRRFQMKPDLCVLNGEQVVAIVDAKWKRLEPERADGRWGIQQADVYQLYAYASGYGCERVALWYPAGVTFPVDGDRLGFDYLLNGMVPTGSRLHIDWVDLGGAGGFGEGWMLSMVRQVRSALGRIGIEAGAVAIAN